jgi:hypothetical protein
MLRSSSIFLSFLTGTLLVGCTTTRIISTDPQAEIYLDDSYVGSGSGTVKSIGWPHSAKVEARNNGEVLATAEMSRSFTWTTALIACISYGTGLLWAWEYPDQFTIVVPYAMRGKTKANDPWSRSPLNGNESIWARGMSATPKPVAQPAPPPVSTAAPTVVAPSEPAQLNTVILSTPVDSIPVHSVVPSVDTVSAPLPTPVPESPSAWDLAPAPAQ